MVSLEWSLDVLSPDAWDKETEVPGFSSENDPEAEGNTLILIQ